MDDQQPSPSQNFRQSFAILVRKYRRDRGWKQDDLAGKSSIPKRTIHDIENAEKAGLDHDLVEKLADAFEITGELREEFFNAAGLVAVKSLQSNDAIEWNKAVFRFYRDTDYPALVTNALGTMSSLNSYLVASLGLDMTHFEHALKASGEINILRLFFQPVFNLRKIFRSEWRTQVQLNMWLFQSFTRFHKDKPEFHKLLNDLETYEGFKELWNEVADPNYAPTPPFKLVFFHEAHGKLCFSIAQGLSNSPEYEQNKMIFYTPLDESTAQAFEIIKSKVHKEAFRFVGTNIVRIF